MCNAQMANKPEENIIKLYVTSAPFSNSSLLVNECRQLPAVNYRQEQGGSLNSVTEI